MTKFELYYIESICRLQIIYCKNDSFSDRVENTVGKGENTGYHSFFPLQMTYSMARKILLFTKRQNFRPVQIQSIRRQQNKCDQKIEICLGKGRKHGGYQHFLLFPQCFQKASFPG